MSDLTPAGQAIRDALAAEFWEFPAGSSTCLYRSSQHGIHHRYDGACAVCRGDLASIARVAVAAVRPVIAAEVLREAADALTWDSVEDDTDWIDGIEDAARQLRERAEDIQHAQTTTHTGGDET